MTSSNPRFLGQKPPGDDQRSTADILNRLLRGKINSVGAVTFTLAANVATTTLSDVNIGGPSFIEFMPMTANAAAERATLYYDTPLKGSVVVHHANNAQTDRTFTYVVLG